MRVADWEAQLLAAMDEAAAQGFAWGIRDCATWALDTRARMTGQASPADAWRGRYSTEAGARREMLCRGWKGPIEAAHGVLGAPMLRVAVARRGDLVLRGGSEPSLGVCLGHKAAFLGPGGLLVEPLANCTAAWRT